MDVLILCSSMTKVCFCFTYAWFDIKGRTTPLSFKIWTEKGMYFMQGIISEFVYSGGLNY